MTGSAGTRCQTQSGYCVEVEALPVRLQVNSECVGSGGSGEG